MTIKIRKVSLHSVAAVGLLIVASVDVAIAGEAPGVEPAQIAAVAVPAARHQPASMEQTGDADVSRSIKKPLDVKRRCEKIQRIGKFTITQCG